MWSMLLFGRMNPEDWASPEISSAGIVSDKGIFFELR